MHLQIHLIIQDIKYQYILFVQRNTDCRVRKIYNIIVLNEIALINQFFFKYAKHVNRIMKLSRYGYENHFFTEILLRKIPPFCRIQNMYISSHQLLIINFYLQNKVEFFVINA